MKELREALVQQGIPSNLIEILNEGILAFDNVTQDVRNGFAHAVLFSAGYDDEGNYVPGFEIKDATRTRKSFRTPTELHVEAKRIEDAGNALGIFRKEYKKYIELQSTNQTAY
ncbi:hypothetical protein MKQ70_16585 [Chitinophaga sedimenti]|uniref:hypothetical protein n=1 Tax=Chitinophaga sedimenti TaxID=2033606 RepID=UPI0020044E10|nr:hypothetical protein [Chitinophaga sedimenti]MCK7556546.1 hypothetical protein [Chitinophaga sedimenti]